MAILIQGSKGGLYFTLGQSTGTLGGTGDCKVVSEGGVDDALADIVEQQGGRRCIWRMGHSEKGGAKAQASIWLKDGALHAEILWPDDQFTQAEEMLRLVATARKAKYEIKLPLPRLRGDKAPAADRTPSYGDMVRGVECELEPSDALPGLAVYFL